MYTGYYDANDPKTWDSQMNPWVLGTSVPDVRIILNAPPEIKVSHGKT